LNLGRLGRQRALSGGESSNDVLRAVPVEAYDFDGGESLDWTFVLVGEQKGQIGPLLKLEKAYVPEELKSARSDEVDEDHRDPIGTGRVARGDILAVADEFGPAECRFRKMPHESRAAAAMLDIRPACFRDARKKKRISLGDELGFT
jgi:hypothetical protein